LRSSIGTNTATRIVAEVIVDLLTAAGTVATITSEPDATE
jgi:hypothetical protein